MACCEGSRREVLILSWVVSPSWRFDRGDLLGDLLGDSTSMRGIGGCLRSAFRACLSFWSLSNKSLLALSYLIPRPEIEALLLYLLFQLLDLVRILHVPRIRLLHDHRWRTHILTTKPIR